jgi:parvulin-like peptidyl-prolyl isomerase
VIRLDKITPAQVKPFEEVRDAVAKELRQQQAENRFTRSRKRSPTSATSIQTAWNLQQGAWSSDSGKRLVQS